LLLLLLLDVFSYMLHEGAELVEHLGLACARHVLLPEQKADHSTQVLGGDTGIRGGSVMRLDDLLEFGNQFAGYRGLAAGCRESTLTDNIARL